MISKTVVVFCRYIYRDEVFTDKYVVSGQSFHFHMITEDSDYKSHYLFWITPHRTNPLLIWYSYSLSDRQVAEWLEFLKAMLKIDDSVRTFQSILDARSLSTQ